MRIKNTPEDIWQHVKKTESCWLWTGGLDKDGYGRWWFEGKNVRAHRMIMNLAGKLIPPNMVSRHTCHVRNCVNPEHIIAGTQKENIHDQLMLGTHSKLKYSNEIIKQMRKEYAEKNVSQLALARKYGVSKSQSQAILTNKTRMIGV